MTEEKKQEVESIVPKRGKWVMGEDGKWREGSAKPELLREDLRKLPSELVTNDIADPNKIHELDPEHVKSNLTNDYLARANGIPTSIDDYVQEKSSEERKEHETMGFNQASINKWRLKAMYNLLNCKEPKPFHGYIWFPEPNFDIIELKEGPTPLPGKRPRHLRDMDLIVDPFDPPESLMRFAQDHGVTLMRKSQWEQEGWKKVALTEKYAKL